MYVSDGPPNLERCYAYVIVCELRLIKKVEFTQVTARRVRCKESVYQLYENVILEDGIWRQGEPAEGQGYSSNGVRLLFKSGTHNDHCELTCVQSVGTEPESHRRPHCPLQPACPPRRLRHHHHHLPHHRHRHPAAYRRHHHL